MNGPPKQMLSDLALAGWLRRWRASGPGIMQWGQRGISGCHIFESGFLAAITEGWVGRQEAGRRGGRFDSVMLNLSEASAAKAHGKAESLLGLKWELSARLFSFLL